MPTPGQSMQVLTTALETGNVMTNVRMLWGPAAIGPANIVGSAITSHALNDSDNAAGWLLCLPRDGVVTDVGFLVTVKSGTPPAFNIGLTVPDNTGRPTTSAYGGSTNTTTTPTTTGWLWVALAASATAVAGEFATVYLWPTGTAPDGSNNISVCRDGVAGLGTALFSTATGLWAASTPALGGCMAIRYDDGFVYGNALTTSTVHVQLRSDSTPDEAGCRFRLPVGMTAIGLRVGLDTSWGATATADVVLYDDSDTVLASTSIGDKDYVDDADYVDVWFDAVNLVAGAYYRLVVKATTSGVGGNTFLQRYQFNGTAERDSWPPGDGNWVYTSRTDAGAWTEVDTDLCYIALWVSAIAFTSAYAYSG